MSGYIVAAIAGAAGGCSLGILMMAMFIARSRS